MELNNLILERIFMAKSSFFSINLIFFEILIGYLLMLKHFKKSLYKGDKPYLISYSPIFGFLI